MRWVVWMVWMVALLAAGNGLCVLAQALPATVGETPSGERIVLAEALRGHAAILVASFSRAAGAGSDEWAKALDADPAWTGLPVFRAAMLEQAPGFVRGFIKAALRKQLSAAAVHRYAVLIQDEGLWRSYFGVTTDKDPYVVLLDADGNIRWHGHGAARDLEPLLKAALK